MIFFLIFDLKFSAKNQSKQRESAKNAIFLSARLFSRVVQVATWWENVLKFLRRTIVCLYKLCHPASQIFTYIYISFRLRLNTAPTRVEGEMVNASSWHVHKIPLFPVRHSCLIPFVQLIPILKYIWKSFCLVLSLV